MTDATDDGLNLTGPLPAWWQPGFRAPAAEPHEYGRFESPTQRSIGLAADLAAIGWKVRRARAVARWLALAGEGPHGQ